MADYIISISGFTNRAVKRDARKSPNLKGPADEQHPLGTDDGTGITVEELLTKWLQQEFAASEARLQAAIDKKLQDDFAAAPDTATVGEVRTAAANAVV